MTVRLIWAQSTNGVVGYDGALPWHVPEDLARFRELTTGGTVVMGRATWESLPPKFRPLPGRHNVVVTRDPAYDAPGATVVTSIDEALALSDDVWIGGGGEIYRATIDDADELYVTDVDGEFAGDTHAPAISNDWRITHRDPADGWHTSRTGLRYRWLTYVRDRAA